MSEPWEDFQQGATVADAPSSDTPPWEDYAGKTVVQIDPYQKAKLAGTPNPDAISSEFTRELVNNPKSIPSIASGLAMAPFDAAGKLLNAGAQDVGAVIGGNPEGFGNVEGVLSQTPADTGRLPYEQTLADISKAHPVVSTVGKVASGLTQTAPMMAAGMPGGALGRLIALGFSADMIKGGSEAATQLGEEMGKNPEDRDADKVTSAVSSLIQSGAFAPLAGAHGLKPGVTGELALSLLKDPKVYPMEKPATPVIETVNKNPWDDFKQAETKPAKSETGIPVTETVTPPAETIVPPAIGDVPTTFAPAETAAQPEPAPAKSPVESLGEGIDFATIQKPHLVGVEAGLKLTPEDVPALQALQKQSVGEMTAAAQTGDNAAFQTLMGKNSFIGGAIEGARRKGPNYDLYKSLKSSPPLEEPITAPTPPPAEPAAPTPETPAAGEAQAEPEPIPELEKPTTAIKSPEVPRPVMMQAKMTLAANRGILESGKWPNGKTLKPAERKQLEDENEIHVATLERAGEPTAQAAPKDLTDVQTIMAPGAKFSRTGGEWFMDLGGKTKKLDPKKDAVLINELDTPIPTEKEAAAKANAEFQAKNQQGFIGMGAAVPEEFKQTQNSPTSIKNATVERERAARGLPPAMEPTRRSFGRVWDEAMAAIDQDPAVQDRLIDELRSKPRALTDFEDALLLHRQIELQNEYGKQTQAMALAYDDAKAFPNRLDEVEELKPRVADLKDRLFDLYEINKSVGTETGRGLNARKMLAYEDYTLAKMELDARAANGGRPLTESESAQVRELHEKIEKLRKEYEDYTAKAQSRISQLEAEKALAEVRNEPTVEPHVRIIAEKIKNYFDGRAASAQKRLSGKTFSFEAALPDLIDLGVSTILSGADDFTIWSSKMLEKLDKSIEPHLKTLWDKSNKALDDHIQKTVAPQNAPKVKRAVKTIPQATPKEQIETKIRARFEEGRPSEITGYVRKLARLYIEEGITDREELIDKIHADLVKIEPTITRRTTMDAISGYGDFKQLSKDEISKELRDLKGQMQQIAKLEDMQAGQPPLKTGLERRIPSKEESRLIKLVNEAKRKFQIPITDPNTQLKSALDTLKTRMQNRIEELRQKIVEGDFAPRPKREPLKLDAEALRIKANYERAKLQFERALQEYRLKNRSKLEKVSDTLVKWRRGFLLSSPITLAKLTSAAIQRLTITPAEEAIGGAISKVIPGVASRARREGGFNTAAEAKAITQAFTAGMRDAAETLKTGASPLDVLYGQGREGYVRESMSLPRSVIDFFGNIHAALKAPVKRAEFARAFEKRVAAAIHEGVDVSDPMVQTRIAVDSYKDANRSIFLQDNRLVTAYKMFLAGLEQKNKETGKPTVGGKLGATAGRLALPIVRVPTNIVAETFTYAFGSMTGAARLANAFAKGFENLQPQEADLIMRELKKGSLGAVALLLGYFNANNFGGYYQPGQKRGPGDVKFGNVKLFGYEIPSFLVHNPLLEVFQLGATIRRVADAKMKGETQGLPAGIAAGALGLTDEVPFVREMFGEIPKMFNPRERGAFFGELAKSIFIPQLLQWLANYTDKDQSGNTNPRSPQTPWQHVETGIPGLRKNVPEKKPTQISQ